LFIEGSYLYRVVPEAILQMSLVQACPKETRQKPHERRILWGRNV